ncbi:BTAD domain-containing putative transcriptional regulator [Amycolatopsis keratiniphila]|uniref:AfsR family transcriptional regulator n=1 Tax=Amycolatopsis keratiniphila subsp. keratiniphila TaxID=227715 RepID=A0A1W2M4B3_9PSEU|nr:BTAD domain-containing putative transcriptional regulator [Amycolatopsis keratiniphila]ONF75162.1 AfsR family transcriptional regulator [Amycolatopsis keratiniphila subsp. keratiniphila]
MRVTLLGPVGAEAGDGTPVDIGGARLRMLLARLALDPGRAVPATALVDGLWGAEPPADAANALQSLVSRLRKVLRAEDVALDSGPGGYRLDVAREDVDVCRFERLAAEGRAELTAGRDAGAAAILAEALGLWRGQALSDVLDAPFAQAPATRLEDLRLEAAEDRFEAEIRLGGHDRVLADLKEAAGRHPLRERLAGLWIRALCAADRQSDALAVYEEVRAALADQLGVDPSAELQEIHLAALRGELGPPPAPADHLPVRLTSFVGRDDELKLIAELLAGARLVTLVGPGGAGKTRLATEVATRHPAHARGRVWFVPLAGVRDPGDLPGAVFAALELWDLGLSHAGDPMRRPADALARVVETLGAGESVLVLDNCEHLVDAAAELTNTLLRRVPTLRVLATSREALAIDGETLCPLGPLAVPEGTPTVSQAAEAGAIRLFVDRAVAVRPDFRLDESTVDDVAQICRRLDGMPLALELAAARLRSMTVAQISQRLDDRFRLLTSGSRTALPRQRTLRAVVEWSWDLLDDAERVLARRLSVFGAGAEVEAVESVCADEGLLAEDILYVLGSLVEKSIVDAIAGEQGEPRYRMLETIRAYAAERLDEAEEREQLTKAYHRYYAQLAERLEPMLRTADQLIAISRYDAEHGNIVTALRQAIDAGDVDMATHLFGSTFWYWLIKGDSDRVESFVAEVLAFGDRLDEDFAAAFQAMREITTMVPGVGDREAVRVLIDECVRTDAYTRFAGLAIGLPMLAFFSQDKELAHREVERALSSPDPWARSAGAWAQSFILVDDGDPDGAEQARDRAYEGFLAVGDRWGTAMTLGMKASDISMSGDHEAALALYRRGLALALELGSQDDLVQQRWRLATEYARAGDLDTAMREMFEAERYASEMGNAQLAVMVLVGKADLLCRAGRVDEAREVAIRFREKMTAVAAPGTFGEEFGGYIDTEIGLAAGDLAAAERGAAAVAKSTAERGDIADLGRIVEVGGLIRFRQGRPETAVRLLGAAKLLRGRLDLGEPGVRQLIGDLREHFGEECYEELLVQDAGLARTELLSWILRELAP